MTEPIKVGVHEHFSGHHYNVIGFGHYVVGDGVEENVGDEVVVYHAMFTSAAYGDQHTWVRPVGNFTEMVEVDGKRVPRFRFVGDSAEQ